MRISIIVGSISDLSQCDKGLKFLNALPHANRKQKVEVTGVYIRSQHRNTLDVQALLTKLQKEKVDVIIVGAGWANHLTGCCDAFLRYTLRDDKITVIGVAFEDNTNTRHTVAASLSISEVPGTQVLYSDSSGKFIGR